MSSIIVKSTSGLLWGTIGSLATVYIANLYKSKSESNKNFLWNQLYVPLAFGGVSGFILGFTKTPLVSLFKYRSK